MLDPHRASRRRSQRGVLTATSLDAGFLVGAENELGGPQGPTVPASLVQVENATCLFAEKAGRILDLYERRWNGGPLRASEFVLCADEKTSIQEIGRASCRGRG